LIHTFFDWARVRETITPGSSRLSYFTTRTASYFYTRQDDGKGAEVSLGDTALARQESWRRSARVVRHILMPHSQQSDFCTWHTLSVPESSHFGPPGGLGKAQRSLFTVAQRLRNISCWTSVCTRNYEIHFSHS